MEITAIKKPIFIIDIPTIGKISCRTCSVADHRNLLVMRDLRNILEKTALENVPQTLTAIDIIWSKMYLREIDEFVEKNKDALAIPSDGGKSAKDNKECFLSVHTFIDKLVADYAHLNFIQINEIDIIDYKLLAADAYKHMVLTNKPDAVDFLNGCYCNMHDVFSVEKLKRKTSEVIISEG